MQPASEPEPDLPTRLRRALELIYAVEGVVAARVWNWPGRVAVGVSVATMCAHVETLRRVEVAVAPLRHPDETWDFGLIGGA